MEYYSDASYSPQYGIGVIGYKGPNTQVITEIVDVKGSTQCELEAFLKMLEHALRTHHLNIIAYTDCNKVIQLINDRKRWYSKFRAFYDRYDQFSKFGIVVYVVKVDGHSPMRDKTFQEKEFKLVDKAVRKTLRAYVGKISEDNR